MTKIKDLVAFLSELDQEIEVRVIEAGFVDYSTIEDEYVPIDFDNNEGNLRLLMEERKSVLLLGSFTH